MTQLRWTTLRHTMLANVAATAGPHGPALYCANATRSVWWPCRFGPQGIEEHFTPAQSRTVMDLWSTELLHTPSWNGDLGMYRRLSLTTNGERQLTAWTAEHGQPAHLSLPA